MFLGKQSGSIQFLCENVQKHLSKFGSIGKGVHFQSV